MNHGVETFTGIRPTADLTVANYIGAVKPLLEEGLSEQVSKSKSSVFLAELHAATTTEPKEVRQHAEHLTETLIASGFKGEIYSQLDVRDLVARGEIAIRGLTTVSRLLRLPTLKEKVRQSDDVTTANVALMMYPTMMASDIILARPNYVPTGKDQKSHLELTNELIRGFNSRYGAELPEPSSRDITPVNVGSLDNSGRKMSKTIPGGAIFLDDTEKDARRKIMKAPTASEPGEDMDRSVDNLTVIAKGLSSNNDAIEAIDALAERAKHGDKVMGQFKGLVADEVVEFLGTLQEARQGVDRDAVLSRLASGHAWFRPIAESTLEHMDDAQWGV